MKKMTKDFFETKLEPIIQKIHSEFESHFRALMKKTDNKWLCSLKKICIQEILQFTTWTLVDNKIKST